MSRSGDKYPSGGALAYAVRGDHREDPAQVDGGLGLGQDHVHRRELEIRADTQSRRPGLLLYLSPGSQIEGYGSIASFFRLEVHHQLRPSHLLPALRPKRKGEPGQTIVVTSVRSLPGVTQDLLASPPIGLAYLLTLGIAFPRAANTPEGGTNSPSQAASTG